MTDPATTPAVVGIDVGGTKSLGLVIDRDAGILVERRTPTPSGADGVVEMLRETVEALVVAAGPEVAVRGVGVGVAGLVDGRGRLRRAPNLLDADGLEIGERLAPLVALPVVVDNDANCAARAELEVGIARGVRDAVLITLGTGIGGALICQGEVVRGAAGMAGEPGHMIVDPDGPVCVCGGRGCWERYASGAGLAHLAREAAAEGGLDRLVGELRGDLAALRGEDVTRAAREGDAGALAVLDRFARWVAVGLANCAAMSDPELIIVGGGLVRDWDLYGDGVRDHLGQLLVGARHRPPIRIEPAAVGEAAGALGAALLARREVGLHPSVPSGS